MSPLAQILPLLLPLLSPQLGDRSPFRAMRPIQDGIEVQIVDGTWVTLVAIAGIDCDTLLREARRLYGELAWKRLTEDLPLLLDALGESVGDTVDLTVRDLPAGPERELKAVAMTGENRRRLWQANKAMKQRLLLTPDPESLSLADATADLAALRQLLDERFAYRALRPVDLDRLLHAATTAFGAGPVPRTTLLAAVDRVLRAFGDGHARVDGMPVECKAFLPFLVQETAGGHVAFAADRSGLLDPERPYLIALEGVPIERWLERTRLGAVQGSAMMRDRDAERGLRDLGPLRAALALPASALVKATITGAAGPVELELPVAARRPAYGSWPRGEHRVLSGNLGYLRLPEMRADATFLDGLDAAMAKFRATRGLVIDVRGNGGGTRDALRRLAPYFLDAELPRVVGNVAAVIAAEARPGHDALADRGLFRADWPGWTTEQRAAVAAFAAGFRPSWPLPEGRFSAWHYLLLDRGDNPRAFPYRPRVVVLIDRSCFSATDVFAAALAALPRVTLIGEPTSGGSGRARRHTLPRSRIRLQLSTMASFRPDGMLFEGTGVAPAIRVPRAPGDLVGTTDTALRRAVEFLAR